MEYVVYYSDTENNQVLKIYFHPQITDAKLDTKLKTKFCEGKLLLQIC